MEEDSLNKPTEIKLKSKINIHHLINWYHGNFCVRHEDCTREHYEELKRIALSWNIFEMTHREFCDRIRQELKCNPDKRKIDDCSICRKLGIPQWRF